jgi:hypothetical protein
LKRIENLNSAFKKAETNHLPVILKLTENHGRLPKCHNKHFEEGFSKGLQN